MKPILYTFSHSSCTWRVRMAMIHKGIEYDTRVINLSKDETTNADFLKINPAGHIPALIVDGKVLAQSMAILEYIEEAYPQMPLLPKDLIERAKVREICELIISEVQPLTHRKVARKYSSDPNAQLEWQHFYINKGLKALEEMFKGCSGKYSVGNQLTMADCVLAPQLYNSQMRFKVDMTPYPKLMEIYKNIGELKAFQQSHPDVQID